MKYKWDLSKLYLKKEDFYGDMTLVRDLIKKLSSHREIKIDGVSLYDLMNRCFKIREINYKTLLYASLNYYSDINNDIFIRMKEQAEELDLFVCNETYFIDELLNIIDEDKLVLFYEECPKLREYEYYISNILRNKKHLDTSDINGNKLNISKKIVEYNSLFNSMDFGKINDIDLNNTNIGKYLISSDRDIRRKSFLSINNSYRLKESEYFNILSSIIELRNDNCKMSNFSSVLESELFKENIDKVLINNLIGVVSDNISLMNKYLDLKMKYLLIDNPTLYDINIPITDISDSFDINSSISILCDVFKKFGDKYIDAFEYLLKNKYLDLECDNNKHPTIVFSWNNYSFMNYKDRYIDLKNLAHEFGHIINSYLSSNLPFIYNDSSVFVGEVASLVNEILLNEYLYETTNDKDKKIFYLTKIIENFISQVYRQIMYTEFENILYNNKKLDLDICNDEYLSLVNKYYGNVVKVDESVKYEWMRVGHLFRWNYYVYKYATGYILAFNIVKKLKEGKYSDEYIDFLSSGSSCSNVDLLMKLDIDLYKKDLIINSFDLLDKYILELEELLEVK